MIPSLLRGDRSVVDIREAEKRLGLPARLIRRAMLAGELKATKDGRFRIRDLDEYRRRTEDRRNAIGDLLVLVEEQEHGWPDASVS